MMRLMKGKESSSYSGGKVVVGDDGSDSADKWQSNLYMSS